MLKQIPNHSNECYYTKQNLIFFPVVRLVFVLLSSTLLFLLFYSVFQDEKKGNYAVVIALSLAYGYISLIEIVYFIRYSKSYSFFEDKIEEFNYLNRRRKRILLAEIEGYKKSSIDYKGFCQKVIILYLKDKTNILLLQSNYFKFKEIENCIERLDMPYLGNKEFSCTYLEL